MYKELVISIIIVILIITLDVITQKYTDTTVNEIIGELSQLSDDIKNQKISDDDAKNNVNETYDKWKEYHNKLSIFIEHNELDKFETEFVSCKSFIESKNYELANSQIEKAIFTLGHIKDKYSFDLENIF